MPNLAFPDQLRQRAHSFLNRRIGINAMLIIEVNVLNAQPLQTSVAGLLHIVRLAIDATNLRVARIADNPELCRQHHLVALALDCTSDEFFVFVRPVDVGGIEKVDAEFKRPMNGRDRFGVIASGVKLRHAHAAQSESGNFEAGKSKRAGLHEGSGSNESAAKEVYKLLTLT